MSEQTGGPSDDPIRDLRVWLIRVILWSLGLAAALGVLSVLTGSYEVGLRAAGTAILTAAAAGVLWSIGSLDRSHNAARKVGLAATLVTYACLLLPLWGIGLEERFVGSALLTGGGGAIAIVFLKLLASDRTRLTGLCGVASCGLLWITAMIGVWTDSLWAFSGDVAETWFAFAVSALLASLCLIGVHSRAQDWQSQDWWRWLGVGSAATAFVVALGMIWDVGPDGDKLYAVAVTISVVVAHINLLLLARLGERLRWLQFGTIAAAMVTAVGINLILLAGGGSGEVLGRITAAASILSGVGTLSVIVLALYVRPRSSGHDEPRQPHEITSVVLTCPVCGTQQPMSLGGGRCSKCQLAIDIRIPSVNDRECE